MEQFMNDIIIRNAVPEDLDTIFAIEQVCFTVPWSMESFRSAFAADMVHIFAAERQGTVIGFGCVSALPPDSEILNIAVLPEARGLGIGSLLLAAMLDCAVTLGADTAYLEVRESNTPARGLYGKYGFVPLGIRRNYYSKPTEHAVVMQKTLTPQ